MTEENKTLDFHEFVLKLPDSAWNLSSESLEHAAQLAKEGAMSGLSPWQAASLYSSWPIYGDCVVLAQPAGGIVSKWSQANVYGIIC